MSQEIEATKMVPSASRRSLTSTDNMVLVEIDHSFRQLLLRELGGKTLDNLYILPCGHKAMEQGIQIRVLHLASQGRRQLSLNCYIVEGVTVKDDGNLVFHMKQASETQSSERAMSFKGSTHEVEIERCSEWWTSEWSISCPRHEPRSTSVTLRAIVQKK